MQFSRNLYYKQLQIRREYGFYNRKKVMIFIITVRNNKIFIIHYVDENENIQINTIMYYKK